MRSALAGEFGFDPSLTVLNHASFGVPSLAMMAEADRFRQSIERDLARGLATSFLEEVRPGYEETARRLGAREMEFALTLNASEGASALAAGWPLERGDAVVFGSGEYPPVIRAWRQAAERAGAHVVVIDVPMPWTDEVWRAAFDTAAQRPEIADAGRVTVVASLAASAPGALTPLDVVRSWARDRGGLVVIDAAHGPAHLDLDLDSLGADAVFGTLHKWLPVPRPIGFLAVRPGLADRIVPPIVSHTHDAKDLQERFSTPGSFDAAPRLVLGAAWRQWQQWEDAGLHSRAAEIAAEADDVLPAIGLRPTSGPRLRAPRLRGFIVPELSVPETRSVLIDAGVRAWVGPLPDGSTGLRVATHVWSESADLTRLTEVLGPHLPI